jgi:Fe-S-cluster containining protein
VYICLRCARQGPTCCRLVQDGDTRFPFSGPEETRLRQAIDSGTLPGFDAAGAVLTTPEANTPSFLESMLALFPKEKARIHTLFPPDGSHRCLALDPGGACVFLALSGCLLPREARPDFCRLFPFWIARGSLVCFSDPRCLAVREERALPGLLLAFGQDRESLAALHRQLRTDWGLEG